MGNLSASMYFFSWHSGNTYERDNAMASKQRGWVLCAYTVIWLVSCARLFMWSGEKTV